MKLKLEDDDFIRNANELFEIAETLFPRRFTTNTVPPPTPAPMPETALTPFGELQVQYDKLKTYVTKVEQELMKVKDELRKSHEVIAMQEQKLSAKPHWQKEVKTALQRISNVLTRLAEKM